MLACAPMRSLIHVPPITAVILCLGISWTGLHAQEKSWSEALNSSSDNSHYTPLKQITKDNVKELKVAWTYPTRDTIAYAICSSGCWRQDVCIGSLELSGVSGCNHWQRDLGTHQNGRHRAPRTDLLAEHGW